MDFAANVTVGGITRHLARLYVGYAGDGAVFSVDVVNAVIAGSPHWNVSEVEFYAAGLSTNAVDNNIDENTGVGPQNTNNPFNSPGNYPGAVGLFQQRLFFGRTNNQPQTWWASQLGRFNNLGTSFPLRATGRHQRCDDQRAAGECHHPHDPD